MASLLEKIHSPEDIKGFGSEELTALCEEMRHVIIDTVSANGGHLASNLGVVELTVALGLAFSPPRDTIVWDVGHQSYPYKLLTGRYPEFATIRKEGGRDSHAVKKVNMICLLAATVALPFPLL